LAESNEGVFVTLNRVRVFWKVAFWALVVLTTVMSLMPNEQVPSSLVFWDKAQHTLGFAALAVLGLLAYPLAVPRVLAGLLLFGAGIECAQALTGWRQGDWMDWLADAVGIALGTAAVAVWAHLRGRSLFAGNSET
jgi:VanZ family protein